MTGRNSGKGGIDDGGHIREIDGEEVIEDDLVELVSVFCPPEVYEDILRQGGCVSIQVEIKKRR
jgi:hypothetical protein